MSIDEERQAGIFRSLIDVRDWVRVLYANGRVNQQAIRIQGQVYEANSAQLIQGCVKPDNGKLRLEFRIKRNKGVNDELIFDGKPFGRRYDWLTDEDLALIGAEVIEADEPTFVSR